MACYGERETVSDVSSHKNAYGFQDFLLQETGFI
jgi:hypothetical protein